MFKNKYIEKEYREYEYEPEYNVEFEYNENLLDTFDDLVKDSLRTKISALPGWIE